MGRKRKHHPGLPERVTLNHGAYYLIIPSGKWIHLGREYHAAMLRHRELVRPDGDVRTMNDLIDDYFTSKEFGRKKPRTKRDNETEAAKLRAVFGRMLPDEITTPDVQEYIRLRGAPVRAAREISLLSTILEHGIRLGALTDNPCAHAKKPTTGKRQRYVTDGEYLAVRDLASPLIRCAMDLALLTGLRRGDLLSLKLSDLKEDGICITQGKNDKPLIIAWDDDLRLAIQAARQLKRRAISGLYVLCNRRGERYSDSGFSAMWQRTMDKAVKAGIPRFTFHDLRAKSGSDEKELAAASERLGHGSQAITRQVYRRKPAIVAPLRSKIFGK